MRKIAIISGTSRPNSRSLKVAKWIINKSKNESIEYELIDLLDYNLSHFNEPFSPKSNKGYKNKEVIAWSNKMKEFDGFIFVVPEYNGFFPGIVKDAVDYLYHEWVNKDFALVGLGGRGGVYACEHLRTLLERFDMNYKGFVGVTKPWSSVSKDNTVDESALTSPLESIIKL